MRKEAPHDALQLKRQTKATTRAVGRIMSHIRHRRSIMSHIRA